MKMKHTQGKWIAETFDGPNGPQEHVYAMIDGEHVDIADIHNFANGEDVANARLIAAAPELFRVLREIVSQIDQGGSGGKVLHRDSCIKAARVAIAKATGGAS